MRLILFDIDGTLVNCGPQVRPLFSSALLEVYGTVGDLDGYSFAGKTDPRIVLDLMTGAGLDEERVLAGLPEMRRLYLERLEEGLDPSRMELLPGVEALLERLSRRSDVDLALLTGNWQEGARSKLARFDLNRFFPFGAFGDDGVERSELVPAALQRATAHLDRPYTPEDLLIVGDTPLDVACARAHGIAVLAVATGHTPATELHAAGADWVASNLPAAGDHLPLFAA